MQFTSVNKLRTSLRFSLSFIFVFFLSQFIISGSFAGDSSHLASNFFSGQGMRIILPVPPAHAIDPFDREQEWTRFITEESIQGATIRIIKRELLLHLERYFKNGLIFGQQSPKSGLPSLRLILSTDQHLKDESLFMKYKEQIENLNDQGYGLLFYQGELIVIARSAVGLLYGTYGLLEKLGFRWFAPEKIWEVRPAELMLDLDRLTEFVNPKTELRGFWTWGGGDDQFLLWMARNRFNLLGDGSYNIDLAKALGVKIWGGGHNVISSILDPSKPAGNGKTLGQRYPDWYGFPPKVSLSRIKSIKWGKDVYRNPCILSNSLENFFSKELLHEIVQGKYAHVDILNLWFSDSKPLLFPRSCKNTEQYSNSTDAILQFYQNILTRINEGLIDKKINNHLHLAGISYYSTWDLPVKVQPPPTQTDERSLARYIHFFYLNQRSYANELFCSSNSSSINRKIANRLREWGKLLNQRKTKFGVVEYYNYSVYLGLPKFFHNLWSDLNNFNKLGSFAHAYMHVIQGNMGPKRLLHRRLSLHGWGGGQDDNAIRDDYFMKLYKERGKEVAESYMILDEALSNITEIFGPVGSLNLYLHQEDYWSKPPFAKRVIKQTIKKIVQGGKVELPIIYKTWPSLPIIKTNFLGLSQAVKNLQKGEWKIKQVMKKNTANVNSRLQSDIFWFSYARQVYEAFELLALKELVDDDSLLTEKYTERQNEIKDELGYFPYKNLTLSDIDQDKRMYRMIGLPRPATKGDQ